VRGRTRIFLLSAIAPFLATSEAPAEQPAPYDWQGFYIGTHSGGALDLVDVANPFGPSIFGDTVRTPGALGGGQFGYNWQLDSGLFGLEADASLAELEGTNTCFAYSGQFVSANCRARIDALGTLAARFGWILPFDPRTLVYGKTGLAWAHGELHAKPNGGVGLPATGGSFTEWGWTVGGGVERAIAPRWTLKAEYGFLRFDDDRLTAPSSLFQMAPPEGTLTPTAAARTHVSQDIHQFKLGMNYQLGGGGSLWQDVLSRPSGAQQGTEIEAGIRYVHGWGQFHKDLGIPNRGLTSLASRLTYENTDTDGAEAFARIDTSFDLMVKGLIGGASGGGQLNDEDWLIPFPNDLIPYSNTISGVDNDIKYWIADVGYDFWRGASYKVAPFIGYSEFRQDMTALGCRQIANPLSDCGQPIPRNVRAIKEDDTWRALRLGTAIDMDITQRITFAGEAAYLPYVKFTGVDDHLLRQLRSPENGEGIGVQLEATLSYALTEALSLGIGGRYWSMWTTEGTVNFGGTGEIVPMRYAAEQAHLLVQGSYKFRLGAAR
jgi:opacity protein-like surface antigen/outer membrane protease